MPNNKAIAINTVIVISRKGMGGGPYRPQRVFIGEDAKQRAQKYIDTKTFLNKFERFSIDMVEVDNSTS